MGADFGVQAGMGAAPENHEVSDHGRGGLVQKKKPEMSDRSCGRSRRRRNQWVNS